ncbi:hypothetical protein CMV_014917 [Castanea mollissima]|uniref:Uncharacterized protein n=1 Tax=Castanea mollissima TaxID=60419 RepID=A0A8J4RAY4_9ROSI|nr:hypothetical protein CMV_014917 [Castanea mollissima]
MSSTACEAASISGAWERESQAKVGKEFRPYIGELEVSSPIKPKEKEDTRYEWVGNSDGGLRVMRVLAMAAGSGFVPKLAWTCYNFYLSTPTKLAGENYFFHFGQDMNVGTSWNILRPETVESLFYL